MAAKSKFTLDPRLITDKIVRVRRKEVMLDFHVAAVWCAHTGGQPCGKEQPRKVFKRLHYWIE